MDQDPRNLSDDERERAFEEAWEEAFGSKLEPTSMPYVKLGVMPSDDGDQFAAAMCLTRWGVVFPTDSTWPTAEEAWAVGRARLEQILAQAHQQVKRVQNAPTN